MFEVPGSTFYQKDLSWFMIITACQAYTTLWGCPGPKSGPQEESISTSASSAIDIFFFSAVSVLHLS